MNLVYAQICSQKISWMKIIALTHVLPADPLYTAAPTYLTLYMDQSDLEPSAPAPAPTPTPTGSWIWMAAWVLCTCLQLLCSAVVNVSFCDGATRLPQNITCKEGRTVSHVGLCRHGSSSHSSRSRQVRSGGHRCFSPCWTGGNIAWNLLWGSVCQYSSLFYPSKSVQLAQSLQNRSFTCQEKVPNAAVKTRSTGAAAHWTPF